MEIKNLFELALIDCPSVKLWLLYLRFCVAHPELVQDLNSEFKRAIALVSWDLRLGHLIFIEQSKLLNQPLTINRAIPYTSQAKNELNIEGFVGPSPFEEFENEFPQNLKKYLEAIKSSKHVTSQDKLSLSRVLFERAINTFESSSASSFDIWESYIKYLRVEMKVSNIILTLNSRLIRAHPLNFKSWILLFENFELFSRFDEFSIAWNEKLPKELLKNHETFLALNLNRLDFLRRTLKDKNEIFLAFQTAIYDEEQNFGGRGGTSTTADPQERLSRYFSQVLIKFGEIEKFRQVWNQILKNHAREAAFWLEYLQIEKSVFINDTKNENIGNINSGFKRAISAVTDYPETIFYEWLQFETQNGSLQSLLDARERVENQRKLLAEREKQRVIKEQKQNYFIETKSNLLKRPRAEIEPMKTNPKPIEHVEKIVKHFNPDATLFVNNLPFNFEEIDIENFFNRLISEFKSQSDEEYSIKSIRMHRNVHNNTFKGHATVEFDSQQTAQILLEKFNKQTVDTSGRPVFLAKYSSPLEKKRHVINNAITTRSFNESDAKTLYVSNIPIDGSIDNIDSLMKNIQGIEQIRHVAGKKFAYIEFSSEEMAKIGLKDIESMKIPGVKVAFSNPPPKGKINDNGNTVTTSTSSVLLKPRSLQIKKT